MGIDAATRWDPDSVGADSGACWRSVHRARRAYARRIAAELEPRDGRSHDQGGWLPLCDLAIDPATQGRPDDPEAWFAYGPATTATPPERRLRAGTRLVPAGWTGDQTEGLELDVWRFLDGPFAGRIDLHVPAGGRYGATGALTAALIVGADEPILRDPARVEQLLADLVVLAAVVTRSPDPVLPAAVVALLAEAGTLDPAALLELGWTPSDHWADVELRLLEERAEARFDPDLDELLRYRMGRPSPRSSPTLGRCPTGGASGCR